MYWVKKNKIYVHLPYRVNLSTRKIQFHQFVFLFFFLMENSIHSSFNSLLMVSFVPVLSYSFLFFYSAMCVWFLFRCLPSLASHERRLWSSSSRLSVNNYSLDYCHCSIVICPISFSTSPFPQAWSTLTFGEVSVLRNTIPFLFYPSVK